MLLERLPRPVRGVRVVRTDPQPSDPQGIGAQIAPYRQLSRDEVERLLKQLNDVQGVIVTTALGSLEQAPFREAGFVDREALHLLTHDLTDRPARVRGGHRLRNARRSDLASVLEIDRRSFDDFWTLDRDSLTAARKATPIHRYQVATIDRQVVGYAITGRSSRASFLQRLAVDPDARGRGIGIDLVADALDWGAREGALSLLVNTQVSNVRARVLYESLGFDLSDEQLVVLERSSNQ